MKFFTIQTQNETIVRVKSLVVNEYYLTASEKKGCNVQITSIFWF